MSKPLKKVNYSLDSVSIQDIENHKIITDVELKKDLYNLKRLKIKDNTNSFAGNNFLYHFQFMNLIKCTRENGKTKQDKEIVAVKLLLRIYLNVFVLIKVL